MYIRVHTRATDADYFYSFSSFLLFFYLSSARIHPPLQPRYAQATTGNRPPLPKKKGRIHLFLESKRSRYRKGRNNAHRTNETTRVARFGFVVSPGRAGLAAGVSWADSRPRADRLPWGPEESFHVWGVLTSKRTTEEERRGGGGCCQKKGSVSLGLFV